MLPDFPKIKAEFLRILNTSMHELVKADPLLKMVQETHIYEGRRSAIIRADGKRDETEFHETHEKYEINVRDIIANGPYEFIDKQLSSAKSLQVQQVRQMLTEVNRVTEETGQIVRAEGKPFSFELFIKALEKLTISFDDNGKPSLPTLILGSEKMTDVIKSWDDKPEYTKKFDALIAQKRKEWDASESHRKLVD